MRVGVPKEIKVQEYRVGLTPMAVREYAAAGHEVLVETGAGAGIGAADAAYEAAGARIAATAAEVFAAADMIVKVKEPQPPEWRMLRAGADPLHLPAPGARPRADRGLIASGCTAIAYETVTDAHGGLPLLAPMSEVAGRLAIEAGGVRAAEAGRRHGPAARRRAGRAAGARGGARRRRRRHARRAHGRRAGRRGHGARPLAAAPAPARRAVPGPRAHPLFDAGAHRGRGAGRRRRHRRRADPGRQRAASWSRARCSRSMRPRSVLVDVSIDQGGCFETSRPTTHDAPTYEVDGVIHYCVANMPGAVPRPRATRSTTPPCPSGWRWPQRGERALVDDPHLRHGLNVHRGRVTCEPVAQALGLPAISAEAALGM